MSDAADMAGDNTDKFESDAIKAISRASERRDILPIIQVLDGIRFGVCHYCESEIRPGHLFCQTDPIDPAESCAVQWEHKRQREKDMGL